MHDGVRESFIAHTPPLLDSSRFPQGRPAMTARPIVAALAVALFALTSVPDSSAATKKKASTSSRSAKSATPTACTDFYTYANQSWLSSNPAMPGVPAVSALDQLRQRAYQQQIDLL